MLFSYPLDCDLLRLKKKALKRQLLDSLTDSSIQKNIAILGGSSTKEVRDMLELFLLEACLNFMRVNTINFMKMRFLKMMN
ncbi:hypothetical protein [Helicobacter enhydrae]|uniref:hypothetical protein n=1 Tax=Helicobacter enhydrae TaxID=222136 RepID=UPI000B2CB795|nr:hypothetical protein [Helicobacter enhydrae]